MWDIAAVLAAVILIATAVIVWARKRRAKKEEKAEKSTYRGVGGYRSHAYNHTPSPAANSGSSNQRQDRTWNLYGPRPADSGFSDEFLAGSMSQPVVVERETVYVPEPDAPSFHGFGGGDSAGGGASSSWDSGSSDSGTSDSCSSDSGSSDSGSCDSGSSGGDY